MENKSEKIEFCPMCGSKVYIMYGCGWDYDKLICAYRGCGWNYELETTTYLEEATEMIDDKKRDEILKKIAKNYVQKVAGIWNKHIPRG